MMTMMKQMELFETTPKAANDNEVSNELEAKWREFHEENPHGYELLKQYTYDVIKAGYKNYSTKAIFERIRWHEEIETSGRPFRLSNSHTAYYARHFHNDHPQYDGFFRTKSIRSRK